MLRCTPAHRSAARLALALILPLCLSACGGGGSDGTSEAASGPQPETFAFESTVSHVFDRGALPPGVAIDDTVTLVFSLILENATEDGSNLTDCDPGQTPGCEVRGWTFPAVDYEIRYSGGHTETGQIDRIEILEGGVSDHGDPQKPEADGLYLFDGGREVYRIENSDSEWLPGAVPESLVDALADVARPSLFHVTIHNGRPGTFVTYHFNYIKPQLRAIVTRSR